MESLKVNNLRSLVDVPEIEFAPITVFVGRNSSGKSTMLRCLPLIKQSLEAKSYEPLLWYGDYVDFGSFEESVNDHDINKDIGITLKYKLNKDNRNLLVARRYLARHNHFYETEVDDFKIKIILSNNNIRMLEIKYYDQTIMIEYGFEDEDKILQFKINDCDMLKFAIAYNKSGFIPNIMLCKESNKIFTISDIDIFFFREDLGYHQKFLELICTEILNYSHKNTQKQTIYRSLQSLNVLASKENICKQFLDERIFNQSFINKINNLANKDEVMLNLNNLILAMNVNSIISLCNTLIERDARQIIYSKPLRANVQRYYRVQGLNIDKVDASGENLPMFLVNLSDSEKRSFNEFTNRLFGFNFDTKQTLGHVSLVVQNNLNKQGVNIADAGVGYSQIMPIIANLWILSRKSTGTDRNLFYHDDMLKNTIFAIEQPELHLHPAFQAKLIDSFAELIASNNLKIILETHSETMIGRLGNLIARERLNSEDVNIYIFDKEENITKVKKTGYTKEGKLTEWPVGFFSPDY